MSHIIPFDSFEEAQEMMAAAETKANAAVTDKQREIAYGTYWIRGIEGQTFCEYGRVLGQQEAEARQTRESIRALRDAYSRGYRFSRAHSLYLEEGELGDTHIAVIWPITEAEFNNAKATRWGLVATAEQAEVERLMFHRIINEMAAAGATIAHPSTSSPQEEDHG